MAKQLHVHHFIVSFVNFYDMIVDSGLRLKNLSSHRNLEYIYSIQYILPTKKSKEPPQPCIFKNQIFTTFAVLKYILNRLSPNTVLYFYTATLKIQLFFVSVWYLQDENPFY